MKREIYIRCDGHAMMGLGHLVRCISLARMISSEYKIHFFCKYIPTSISEDIIRYGFLLTNLDREDDFFERINKHQIVVLDGYGFDGAYQRKVKEKRAHLVVINDLPEDKYYADLIINHAPGISPEDYDALPFTHYYLGPEFALIRPEFCSEIRNENRTLQRNPLNVFICFGGSDYLNLTLRALQLVLSIDKIDSVTVVTGSAYKFKDDLSAFVRSKGQNDIRLFSDIDAYMMAQLMRESDLVIVPCSGILMEALASAKKVVSGYYVDNQKLMYSNFKKLNAFYDAEDFNNFALNKAIESAFSSERTDKEDDIAIIDGRADKRLLKALNSFSIKEDLSLRKANEFDLDLTFKWAVNDQIRKYSFNQHKISKAEHKAWFLKKISTAKSLVLIVYYHDYAAGLVRFDVNDSNEAIISYLLDPLHHGIGIGQQLLASSIEFVFEEDQKLNVKSFVGYVLPSNTASKKIFERLGFKCHKENEKLVYTKAIKPDHERN